MSSSQQSSQNLTLETVKKDNPKQAKKKDGKNSGMCSAIKFVAMEMCECICSMILFCLSDKRSLLQ